MVVPAVDFGRTLDDRAHAEFERLYREGVEVWSSRRSISWPDVYLDAGIAMLDRADRLIAVWDGGPERGRGGTAQIVRQAEQRRLHVYRVWPEGAARR